MEKRILYLILFPLLISCQKNAEIDMGGENYTEKNPASCSILDNGWTVDRPSLVKAEESSLSIPTLYDPAYVSFVDLPEEWLGNELAIGIQSNEKTFIFPHRILDKHEIVQFDANQWITLCPLAGTAIGINSTEKLHVSGYLFNSNLMIGTSDNSVFSQMLTIGMSGEKSCMPLSSVPLMEASMVFWKSHFPNANILSSKTGFNKNYAAPPFQSNVQPNATLFFPVDDNIGTFPNYEYMHGIRYDNKKAKVYPQKYFDDGPTLILDFLDKPVMIIGDSRLQFFTSYYLEDDQGVVRDFELMKSKKEIIIKDKESNSLWNIWGEAIEGPATKSRLIPTKNHNGYWYAFYAMYQSNLEFYKEDDDG